MTYTGLAALSQDRRIPQIREKNLKNHLSKAWGSSKQSVKINKNAFFLKEKCRHRKISPGERHGRFPWSHACLQSGLLWLEKLEAGPGRAEDLWEHATWPTDQTDQKGDLLHLAFHINAEPLKLFFPFFSGEANINCNNWAGPVGG